MIKVKVNTPPKSGDLMNLFSQVDWAKNRKSRDVEKMLSNEDWMVCLYDGELLVGFARIITDGCFRGLLDDVIIDRAYRSKGLGRKLMQEIMALSRPLDALFLNAGMEMEAFYVRFGFHKFEKLTMIYRK
ncbi:GNAT family N-acetyltransferase [Pleomorphovibrio marinus]|uniref:GNAT family N-acetyltransferase n=1 Tax=Pleomorphovibrio marinus TaxID=2164132 RepID=UPI0013001DF1|nr:GNAT family N-acetyltransferase [Pleomorphovibrio marinus]